MKTSILRNMFLAYLGFGIMMGIIFPFFADFFVTWKDGMYIGFTISCLVAGVVMGLATFQIMKVMLVRKLETISEVTRAISNNDLTYNCEIESDDVIGEIIDSFNVMSENLRTKISALQTNCHNIETSVQRVSRVASETAEGADLQFSEVQQVQQAVSQLTSVVDAVNHKTDEALNLSQNARQSVTQGSQIISQTENVIKMLSEQFEHTSATISELKKETENIGTVLEVIQGISEQTNLLALNAAIEAARAGEQGRGFAVVADEVRTLAQRTQESTHTIQEIIEGLQKQANSAEQITQASSKEAANGVAIVIKAKESFEHVTETMNAMTSMSNDIKLSTDSQLQLVNEIDNNISNVSNIASRSQSGAHDSAEESEQLSVLSKQLDDMFGQFKLG
jgi:methyl-accepting chemotaxis protein